MSRNLIHRVFCPECGAVRICHRRSPFAVCPNGHGRLVRRFTKAELWQAIALRLPLATKAKRVFTIEGRDGKFVYRNGNGLKPARPGDSIKPGEVIARRETRARRLVRVFSPVDSSKSKSE